MKHGLKKTDTWLSLMKGKTRLTNPNERKYIAVKCSKRENEVYKKGVSMS